MPRFGRPILPVASRGETRQRGGKIAELAEAMQVTVTANAGMKSFYEGMKSQFA